MPTPGRLATWAMLAWLAGFGVASAAEPERPIAVIVSRDHSGILKLADVALIFRRKKLFWNEGLRVAPVNLPANHALRQAFSRIVLGSTPEEMEKYWNNMYFHGTSPPFVLSSEEAVIRFVTQTPGAIGYISFCNADARVKVTMVLTSAGQLSEDGAKAACLH